MFQFAIRLGMQGYVPTVPLIELLSCVFKVSAVGKKPVGSSMPCAGVFVETFKNIVT